MGQACAGDGVHDIGNTGWAAVRDKQESGSHMPEPQKHHYITIPARHVHQYCCGIGVWRRRVLLVTSVKLTGLPLEEPLIWRQPVTLLIYAFVMQAHVGGGMGDTSQAVWAASVANTEAGCYKP